MEASFTGQNIAVTGGFSGIGLATAKALSNLGANVFIADFGKDIPEDLKDNIKIHSTPGVDVSDRSQCQKFMQSIPGRLDGLVNCAGISPPEGKIASDEAFQRIMAVNVTGTWNMGTEAIQRMSKQEVRRTNGLFTGVDKQVGQGSIVNISSGAGFRGLPGLAVYCASKHAVIGLVRSWAKDWATIRFNAVSPGVTDTPLLHGVGKHGEEGAKLIKVLEGRVPMGRLGLPTDIADVVCFLLSDAAAWMTGQVLPVNGGSD